MLRLSLSSLGPAGRAALLVVLVSVRPVDAGGDRSCAAPSAVRARWLMGTVLEVRLPAGSGDLAEAAFDAVAEVERAASTWREDSELSRVHRAGRGPFVVSEPLAAVLDVAASSREATGGAFDPSVGALVNAYALHGAGRWPASAELDAARGLVGERAFRWDSGTRTLTFTAGGVRLDLDGVAKGAALDRAATRLRAAGVRRALLNFGGQVLAVGPPPGCPAEEVVVASPDASSRPTLRLELRDASVSTSANSERAALVDGRPFGHLLDPRSGRFAAFQGSVSVIAPSAAQADALSTAYFVLGPASLARPHPSSVRIAFLVPEGSGSYRALTDPGFTPVTAGP